MSAAVTTLRQLAAFLAAEEAEGVAQRAQDAAIQAQLNAGAPNEREMYAWTPEFRAAINHLGSCWEALTALSSAAVGQMADELAAAEARAEQVAQELADLKPSVMFTERADYKDKAAECALVGRVFQDGVRIGFQCLEQTYATGVLIPPTHPAYMPAQRFLAALATEDQP